LRGIEWESHEHLWETPMSYLQESKLTKHDAMNQTLCQQAQGLVEYAFLIVLVALIVVVVLALFGQGVGNMFSNIISNI
jgi:pilus assembly protein Flp/PilA